MNEADGRLVLVDPDAVETSAESDLELVICVVETPVAVGVRFASVDEVLLRYSRRGHDAGLPVVVIGGWFIDAQRVPEIGACNPNATLAQRQRCAEAEYAKIQPSLAYMERIKWWRGAALVVVFGTAGASLGTAALVRRRDARRT